MHESCGVLFRTFKFACAYFELQALVTHASRKWLETKCSREAVARRAAIECMRDQLASLAHMDREEELELEELRRLLERTSHELVANGARCGDVSTKGLRRLPDGQNETSVELFYRRKAEAEHAQRVSGMPAWDSTPFRGDEGPKPVHVPMRELEGERSTWEQRVWAPMMKAKRDAMRNGEEDEAASAAPEHKLKPKHAEMIEQMMRAYRHEQGAPKVRSRAS